MTRRELGESAAADGLVAAVRRLMRATATASCPDDQLRQLTDRLDAISELIEPSAGEGVRRIPVDEGRLAGLRAGQVWRMFPFNPLGISQSISIDGGVARSVVQLSPLHEGPPDLLHGGFSAAILDALIGVVVMAEVVPAYSVQLDVSFRRAVRLHGTLEAAAWVTQVGARRILAQGTISHAGQIAVEARGVFVPIDQPR